MLNRLLRLFESSPSSDNSPKTYTQQMHGITKSDISHSAVKVIAQLQEKGYSAYLVGGGVRDLLLDGKPKDFDVATDATPEEIRSVFRNSRIIGKRFRIVHVRFGREIIEVTTFRGSHTNAQQKGEAAQSDKGMLLRDNVYGDIKSDALRRDFTINALYYNPQNGEILDFAGGMADLQERRIKIIGDASERYKEDPVRMLRAVRFCAKLAFTLDGATETPIYEHAGHLADIPSARLFEEVLKLFLSGYATSTLHKLREFGLLAYLFPGTDALIANDEDLNSKLVFNAANNTDKRLRRGKRVTPAFVYAAMLWPQLRQQMTYLQEEQKLSLYDSLQQAAQGVITQQLSYTSIPKRFLLPMRDIWNLQWRLNRREGKRAQGLMEHQRFRAAYDFLLLREESGEELGGLGTWWTNFQNADEEQKEALIKSVIPKGQRNPRKRRRSPKKKVAQSGAQPPKPSE